MAIRRFQAWKSTVTPLTARWTIPTDKWLIEPETFAIVGAQNPNFFGADARFTPVDISVAELLNPPALLLADLDAIFRLAVFPFTWYRSDGIELIPLGTIIKAGSGIAVSYDVLANTYTISATNWNPCCSLYDRKPDAGEILLDITLSYDVTLPAGLAGSGGGINTLLNGAAAATGDSVFTLYKDGSSIGTGTIPAGMTGRDIASFGFASTITIPAGHSFQLQAPISQDATLQGVSFSILGERI